jgi:protease-4
LWYNYNQYTVVFLATVLPRSVLMKRRTWYWVTAVLMATLIICGGFVGLGLVVASAFEGGGGLPLGDAVAIVRVEGVIVPGNAPPPTLFSDSAGNAYSQTIIDQLKRADENNNVKAVILFVDSPGGSVFASDEIALQVEAMSKPIIAAMGSLAASGGYFVSAPTDEIWASPYTLTCSIGVISQFINVEGFAEEWGITTITVKSGQYKDTGNPFREFTEADRILWQDLIDEAYAAFVSVVADGRGMSDENVRSIADGRICSGLQAQEMGLVDNMGYLPDVIERAGELGGIEGDPRVIEYDQQMGVFDSLTSSLHQPGPVEQLRQLLHFNAGSPLMYLYTGP